MRKKILYLMNATAGKGEAKRKLYKVIENLTEEDCEVTVYPIVPSDPLLNSETIIAERGNDFDEIVCCGGDGTINHCINTIMNTGVNKPIGYIPAGSTNDFSKNINGNMSLDELCDVFANGQEFPYDIGSLNGKYFNYVAGFGAFTNISYDTNQDVKNLLGYGAYMLKMMVTLPQSLAYNVDAIVEHDGIVEEGNYIFCGVTNSIQIAGVKSPILDKAELNDGYFEVLLITSPSDLIEVNDIIATLSSGSLNSRYVKAFKTDHVTFRTKRPVDWTLDGEFGGNFDVSEIKVHKQAIRIMTAAKE